MKLFKRIIFWTLSALFAVLIAHTFYDIWKTVGWRILWIPACFTLFAVWIWCWCDD